MHKYFLKIPWWMRQLFPAYLWKVPVQDRSIYLTFDDGPHPLITPWVLKQLAQRDIQATFFCIGRNVEQFPLVYQQIIQAGHATGNHTYSHVNGWKTATPDYLADTKKAAAFIDSHLFRPPYGRIKKEQAKGVAQALGKPDIKIVMWDVLSADFDPGTRPEECASIVLKHTVPGSIIVFHDSEKAFTNLQHALPLVLDRFSDKGFQFKTLENRP